MAWHLVLTVAASQKREKEKKNHNQLVWAHTYLVSKSSLLIFCCQQCNSHHLSQQVCPSLGGSDSRVQECATATSKKEGVMMDKSFQLPVSKLPVSGEPLCTCECCPEKAWRSWIMPSTCCLSGTALKWHVPCWSMILPRAGAPHPRCPFSILIFWWAPASGQLLLLDFYTLQTSHLGLARLSPTTLASDSLKGRFNSHFLSQHLPWRICGNLSAETFGLQFALH